MYKHPIFKVIKDRILDNKGRVQVLVGPRQVGKSTVVQQVLDDIDVFSLYRIADSAGTPGWIEEQWNAARLLLKKHETLVLVLDEVQKIRNWGEIVKKLHDEDVHEKHSITVMLLGSSQLLIQRGLSESMAGRFELMRMSYWSYPEMRDAFSISFDEYLYFGGYPGGAPFFSDEIRWKSYIRESLVESIINRDIMLMQTISKPALFRQVFSLACRYSGKMLSYNKMLGQLQDAGNTVTVANYLSLCEKAGLVSPLERFSHDSARKKRSSPKLQVHNTALYTVFLQESYETIMLDPELRGRIYENAAGAWLMTRTIQTDIDVFYWRDGDKEVDFVLVRDDMIIAVEVKSTAKKQRLRGMETFLAKYPHAKPLLIGPGGLAAEDLFSLDIMDLFKL